MAAALLRTVDTVDAVYAFGVQAPVIALHSLFFDGSMFEQIAMLTDRTIIAPDFRGQGTRRGDPERPHLDLLASDTIEVIRSVCDIAGRRVHLVGSSMGAYVAAIVAARIPGLVRSVVLSAATGDVEQRPEKFAELVRCVREDNPGVVGERLLSTMFGAYFREHRSDEASVWRRHFEALDRSVADAAHEVFTRRPIWADIDAISAPVLLFAGDLDTAKRPEDMRAISTRIGCADPIVFARSGHTPFVEESELAARSLRSWWRHNEIKEEGAS